LRTLFWALEILGLPDQGFEELDAGFKHRLEDGELMLFAAEVHARYGHFERAEQFLRAAKGKTRRAAWLRAAAELEGLRSDPAAALELWKLVADAAPLDLGAQRALAQCLAETLGRAAALEHLRALAERFPHHLGILALRIEWLRQEPAAEAEACIRRMVELDPQNAWARRQLAWNLHEQHRLDEAFAEAAAARTLHPSEPACAILFGSLCQRAGRIPEARAAFQETLRLSVEETFALARLMDLSDSPEERRAAILYFHGELVRQVTHGDGLLAFRQHARGILSDEEILAKLHEAHAARPDLWHSWSALVRQFLDMNRAGEALETARAATERFPLMARVWLDRANACRATKDEPGEIDALQQAYQTGARWGPAARQLADAYSRKNEVAKAREILEAAATRDPLDPANHGLLAEALWHLGEKDAALARIERAVLIEPGYEWAWNSLRQWAEETGQPQRAAEGARALAQRRPGEARSWLVLAKMLTPDAHAEERLTALDQALKLNPRIGEAHDLRAETLAALQRWEDALAACRPAVYGERPPLELRGRAAWIKAEAGRLPEAIAALRTLLAEAPEYAWGWYHLVRWLYRGDDPKSFLDAAETFARLDSASALAQGYLGDARLRAKDRTGAQAAFERALALDPNYSFSFASLFDMKLEDNDLDGARAILAQMPGPDENPSALARAVRLAARIKDESAAIAALRKLALRSAPNRGYLDDALKALEEPGWARQANQVLEEISENKDAPPFVAEIVVERLAKRRLWDEAARLAGRLLDQGDAGVRAASELLSAMAEANEKSALLHFIEQHRHPLHLNTRTWGYAGYALATVREYGSCIHWLNDWNKRAGVEPWMLSNLTLSLEYRGQEREALEVSRGALKLPADHTVATHRIWAALHEAFGGDAAAAQALLKEVNAHGLKPFNRFLHTLAEAAAVAGKGMGSSGAETFAILRNNLASARKIDPNFRKDAIERRYYLRCAARIAAARGSVFAYLWLGYQRLATIRF
ncbi:MAG: tetratricopeptide repeat protein, partial [Planctomycetes bacterium]|nr:tetratricopeptide repeat protein [Planctomycetota bacterium]